MAYTQGQKITSADFNNFAGQLNDVWAIGSGDEGYGQTEIPSISTGDIINSSAEWTDLQDVITRMAEHQGTAISGAIDGSPGDLIDIDQWQTNITNVTVNRLNASGIDMSISNAGTTTRGTSWGGATVAINTSYTLTWSTLDEARHFFNAGGEIISNPSHVSNATPQDEHWGTFCDNVGGIPLTNTTYYGLTGAYSTIFNQTYGVSAYTANSILVEASKNVAGNIVTIRTTMTDAHVGTGGGPDSVSSGTDITVTAKKATLSKLNDAALISPSFAIVDPF